MKSIAVWFSCGAASAVAAKKTLELYGDTFRVRVVNSPVMEENPDNARFLADVEKWLGVPVECARSPRFPKQSAREVWERKKYMSGVQGAPCTLELKKRARYAWEAANPVDWHVLGFTADEKARHARFVLTERENVLPVLINENISKADCFKIVLAAGLTLPAAYSRGYPNANCIGCVKSASPTYWNLVRQKDPDVFADRAEQSRRIGARLVILKGKRIFLDELPADAVGGNIHKADCGVFCEERPT